MFKGTPFQLERWIEKHLPANKKEYSRDAVEILLSLLWDEAQKAERSDVKAREESERYGDL